MACEISGQFCGAGTPDDLVDVIRRGVGIDLRGSPHKTATHNFVTAIPRLTVPEDTA
jgi:hypothetical protein